MLWVYRILFFPVLLISAPYYLLRMWRRGGYGGGFGQRFGRVPELPGKRGGVKRIWIQAVSVGEMLAIGPLLEGLAKNPRVEVYLTTTTSTGHKIAQERYRGMTIGIGYFPIDAWLCSVRAWKGVCPDMVLLTEGERWPEHIAQAKKRSVPVVCVNARLSDRSFRRMNAWRGAVKPLLAGVTKFLACSEEDALRLKQIGVEAGRIVVTGNIKLDIEIAPLSVEEKETLRRELGLGVSGVPILLGSSTWPGEEKALVDAWLRAAAAGIKSKLLLVPRHAERRADVVSVLKQASIPCHLRSRGAAQDTVDVAIADTTGELRKLTQLADIVVIGKSLPPNVGGQTPVEAAALGKAMIFGPEMSNFRVISRELLAVGAAEQVQDAGGLSERVEALLKDDAARDKMAESAERWHKANQGAVLRTQREIERVMADFG